MELNKQIVDEQIYHTTTIVLDEVSICIKPDDDWGGILCEFHDFVGKKQVNLFLKPDELEFLYRKSAEMMEYVVSKGIKTKGNVEKTNKNGL